MSKLLVWSQRAGAMCAGQEPVVLGASNAQRELDLYGKVTFWGGQTDVMCWSLKCLPPSSYKPLPSGLSGVTFFF